jgi:hypothetical protein
VGLLLGLLICSVEGCGGGVSQAVPGLIRGCPQLLRGEVVVDKELTAVAAPQPRRILLLFVVLQWRVTLRVDLICIIIRARSDNPVIFVIFFFGSAAVPPLQGHRYEGLFLFIGLLQLAQLVSQ